MKSLYFDDEKIELYETRRKITSSSEMETLVTTVHISDIISVSEEKSDGALYSSTIITTDDSELYIRANELDDFDALSNMINYLKERSIMVEEIEI